VAILAEADPAKGRLKGEDARESREAHSLTVYVVNWRSGATLESSSISILRKTSPARWTTLPPP